MPRMLGGLAAGSFVVTLALLGVLLAPFARFALDRPNEVRLESQR